ncbi:MerR family transcriptional regulator [Amycolatopsis oliviviridis]|uniref:Transcriptional regulator n=1 Tax=Amycolatopsis oliviviridis TaxID=1471590 RepID=A0ABQ3LYS6_9PSEU|nr:MerR family transcriptional regulator [Amycolatopsis oliviviridis]GHH29586.1 transcriptional regulator [Amycolatopsis oliviviridis]
MRIGELVRRTGVRERLLRYYEEQDLLHPVRRASGYREYSEQDVGRVRNIRTLLSAGLSTATIAGVLPCMVDLGNGLAPACADLLPELYRERERISTAIDEMTATRDVLDGIIAATVPHADEVAEARVR